METRHGGQRSCCKQVIQVMRTIKAILNRMSSHPLGRDVVTHLSLVQLPRSLLPLALWTHAQMVIRKDRAKAVLRERRTCTKLTPYQTQVREHLSQCHQEVGWNTQLLAIVSMQQKNTVHFASCTTPQSKSLASALKHTGATHTVSTHLNTVFWWFPHHTYQHWPTSTWEDNCLELWQFEKDS